MRAIGVAPAGTWSGAPDDTVVLDFDERHRRRYAMRGVRGLEILLDLSAAAMIRGGDALILEDGRRVEVLSAPELLVEVRASDPQGLMRLAWHLGNRHLPVQIGARSLRMRRDPVIEAMLAGLGGRLTTIEAPFDPEGGAYAAGRGHGDHHADHHAHHHSDVSHTHA